MSFPTSIWLAGLAVALEATHSSIPFEKPALQSNLGIRTPEIAKSGHHAHTPTCTVATWQKACALRIVPFDLNYYKLQILMRSSPDEPPHDGL
jgi:hypothetical protein